MKQFFAFALCLLLGGRPWAQVAQSRMFVCDSERRTNGHLVGRGKLQALQVFRLALGEPLALERIRLEIGGDDATSIERYQLYLTKNADRYDPRTPGLLLAEAKPEEGGATLRAVKGAPKISSNSPLWLVADISSEAPEGHRLSTKVVEVKLAGAPAFSPDSYRYEHEVVLQRTLIWAPGENHSAHYRIPALVCLANGDLVASIDKRKHTDRDLPADIDVEVKISRDQGRTWSAPVSVAKGSPEHGYGDAAMATDGRQIYMVMVAGSGLWRYPSEAEKPLEMYFTKSSDGGYTWAPLREISQEVYGQSYKYGGFFGSGNGIVTSTGRIAFVAALRTEPRWGGRMDNVLVYSDDEGRSWQTSPVARPDGDEAKVVELSGGEFLVSSRNRAGQPTPRTWVRSADGGRSWTTPQTWPELVGNACNTGLMRYGKGPSGGDLLLHTLIESPKRDHLRIYLSEDGGKTWPFSRTLCDGEAAYSELVRLPNGNIGVISEEDDRPAYDIYFTEISLDWIRQGRSHD